MFHIHVRIHYLWLNLELLAEKATRRCAALNLELLAEKATRRCAALKFEFFAA